MATLIIFFPVASAFFDGLRRTDPSLLDLARLQRAGKLALTFRARHGIRQRYEAWAAEHRDRTKKLLWMHAPSVGEALMRSEPDPAAAVAGGVNSLSPIGLVTRLPPE